MPREIEAPYCEPVGDYSDALRWLVKYERCEEWIYEDGVEPPKTAHLVCAMFWENMDKLRKDLRKLYHIPTSRHSTGWRRDSFSGVF